jgi:dynein assembly factor 1
MMQGLTERAKERLLQAMIVTNPETNENEKRMTKDYLHKLLRSDFQLYYCTPELNDSLYLHYKGFIKLENLEQFTELKVLYCEGNCIERIENLDNCKNIRCLYL